MNGHAFAPAQRQGVYQAIYERRDIRAQFVDTPLDDAVLHRILKAAHHAPSVGFMQPWNFLVIRDFQARERVHRAFTRAHRESAAMFTGSRRQQYQSFKLEGILEAPVNLLVTCDRSRSGPVVIGRTVQPDMDLYSTVCAVQNLWLAARAEGVGVGWVSIVHEEDLRRIFDLPADIAIIAYLCLGYVSHFPEKPELEKAGWLPRLSLEQLIYYEKWGQTAS